MMGNLLRAELYKLRHNKVLWIGISIFIVVSFLVSNARYSIIYEGRMSISVEETIFWLALRESFFSGWSSIIFAAILFGAEFWTRSWNPSIYAGIKREKIFITKVMVYYCLFFLMNFIFPVISCLQFSLDWILSLGIYDIFYVVRCICLYLIAHIGAGSISLIPVFIFNDPFRAMASSFILTISQYIISTAQFFDKGSIFHVLVKNPLTQLRNVMDRVVPVEHIILLICSSILLCLISILISLYIFRNVDLT